MDCAFRSEAFKIANAKDAGALDALKAVVKAQRHSVDSVNEFKGSELTMRNLPHNSKLQMFGFYTLDF